MPARRIGDQPPRGRARNASPQERTRMDPEDIAALDRLAADRGVTRSDLIREAVDEFVELAPGMVAPRRPYGSDQPMVVWTPGAGQKATLTALAEAYTVLARRDDPRAKTVSVTAIVRRAVRIKLAGETRTS